MDIDTEDFVRNQYKIKQMPLILFISSVSVLGMNGDNTDSQKLNKIISEIQALQEVVARFRQLRLDATEFACLKCIVTFKAGK